MALQQLNLDGRTKVEESIHIIRQYEPDDEYHVAFSGGKDSQSILRLTVESEAKFKAYYHIAPTDPPELVQFIRREYPDVIFVKKHYNFWDLIVQKGLPTRFNRWCCEYIKEWGGEGKVVITGVRAAESVRRKHRPMIHKGHKTRFGEGARLVINPIIGWSKRDVWEFLELRGLNYCSLYDEGASGPYKGDGYWQRLGCILCPMVNLKGTLREMERWPKLADHWKRACYRLFEAREQSLFNGPEELWQWWLSRGEIKVT